MNRRYFLQGMLAGGLALVAAVPAAAKQLRQRLKRVSISVGKTKKVKIDGERAFAFTLGPDKLERGTGSRQREEMRDTISHAKGTVHYSIEFLFPTIDDPDGRLERQFTFFQIKPKDSRTKTNDWFPYVNIQMEPDYRRKGIFTEFEFKVGNQIGRTSHKPIQHNKWYRLDVVVKWTQANDGFATVELDGNRIASFKGKTGPDGEPLVNFGIYRAFMHRADPAKVETLQFYVRRYTATQIAS